VIFRPPSAWPKPLHVVLTIGVSMGVMALSKYLLDSQEEQTVATQSALFQQRQLAKSPNQDIGLTTSSAGIAPNTWPARADVDHVVQLAGKSALELNVSLRSINVSTRSASVQSWGSVSLDVSGSGSYSALKAWQSGMQKAFPALAVQTLRIQAPPNGAGLVEAQWTWVLHVRD
jgi:hypothetical protein